MFPLDILLELLAAKFPLMVDHGTMPLSTWIYRWSARLWGGRPVGWEACGLGGLWAGRPVGWEACGLGGRSGTHQSLVELTAVWPSSELLHNIRLSSCAARFVSSGHVIATWLPSESSWHSWKLALV